MGVHLLRKLLAAGQDVVGVGLHDDRSPIPSVCGPFRREGSCDLAPGAVAFAGEPGTFAYLPLDLVQAGAVRDLLLRLRPAVIYHLAAQSSAAVSFARPAATVQANVLGTLNLLEGMLALPEAQRPVLLNVGSGEEYGPHPPDRQPLAEDTPLRPCSPYGVSKVAQTLLCLQYVRSYDLPVVTVRAFNHTGPGQDTRFVFPSFARQIAAAEAGAAPPQLAVGNLDAVRDFLDVRDVIAAYGLLVKEGSPGQIYHVCSGNPLTIRQGLDILLGAARCPISLRNDPDRNRPSDLPFLVGDNAKLRAATGWAPEWDVTRTLLSLLAEARKEFT